MSILVQAPEQGLNYLAAQNMIDPRGAANGSSNILYRRGILQTAHGFSKLDLTTTGINGTGESVIAILPFQELDGYSHFMALTNSNLIEHDVNNSTWVDRTQAGFTFSANIDTPSSGVVMAHNDTAIYLNDDPNQSKWFYHFVVSDGGNSDIQRWAGRFETDTGNLGFSGASYHDGTTHRALQVESYQSRLILISPYNYSASSKVWTISPQRVQYPQIGKLESWAGTGSGFVDLLDTGGFNVWSAQLGGQHIVYQTNGIWTLRYVGGSTVFSPYPYIPNTGLLAPHLLVAKDDRHYFIGTDYNVYAYQGGSVLTSIGDKIHDDLESTISKTYEYRCIMSLDEREERLWIFIVADGDAFIRYAYGLNLKTGAWMKRDFLDAYDGALNGITAVSLIGSTVYTVGDTYQNALDSNSIYDADQTDSGTAGDATIRYGDVLTDTSAVYAGDWSDVVFPAGGASASLVGGNFEQDFTENSILVSGDGSDQTNVSYGTHFYTMYDVSPNGFKVYPRGRGDASTGSVDYGIADSSTNVPSFDATSTNWAYNDPSGTTYRQSINEALTGEALHIGDASGFVYVFDEDIATDDGNNITSEHITPVYDMQQPDIKKRWPGIALVALGGSGTDTVGVYYNIDDAGWVLAGTQTLETDYKEVTQYINRTGKRIQFKFTGTGNIFKIREYSILTPGVEDDR